MAKWRPPRQPGKMNKTEALYEATILEARRQAGEITRWNYEGLTFRLGLDRKTTYTPDFVIFLAAGEIELVDVKGGGGWEPHTRIKIKTAARIWPEFHWVGELYRRGVWTREEF